MNIMRRYIRERCSESEYLCEMQDPLHNPVYHALGSGDKHLGFAQGKARAFYEEVSPFAGFADDDPEGFDDLYELIPRRRYILFANSPKIEVPEKWKVIQHVEGIQMIFGGIAWSSTYSPDLVPLNTSHVDEMITLAELTKPGPFAKRTIEFGNYFGIFDEGKLVAMAGQRMHINNYTEVSAVCTHPDHVGRGYATRLVQHLVHLISENQQTPFLHVRADNHGAIRVYERLGFYTSRPMNFYFMKKRN